MCTDVEALLSLVLLLVSSLSIFLMVTRGSEGEDAAEMRKGWGSRSRDLCHCPGTWCTEHLTGTFPLQLERSILT